MWIVNYRYNNMDITTGFKSFQSAMIEYWRLVSKGFEPSIHATGVYKSQTNN